MISQRAVATAVLIVNTAMKLCPPLALPRITEIVIKVLVLLVPMIIMRLLLLCQGTGGSHLLQEVGATETIKVTVEGVTTEPVPGRGERGGAKAAAPIITGRIIAALIATVTLMKGGIPANLIRSARPL